MPLTRTLYRTVSKSVSIPDATAVRIDLPQGSKEHTVVISTFPAFRFHTSDTNIATEGTPLPAYSTLRIDAEVIGHSLWIYQASGGALTLHHAFLRPETA